jgi:nucleoside phosphorylase
MRLGVIVALEAEAAAILADPRFEWESLGSGGYSSRAFPVRLEVSGVGKVFASWACARLIGEGLAPGVDLMLSLGTSGGLSSEEVGSLLLVKEFVEHDMLVTGLGFEAGVTPFAGMAGPVISSLSPDAEALALAALSDCALSGAAPDAVWARSASGDRFIGDAAEAAELRIRTGASLCDMESAAIAKLCAYRGGGAGGSLDFFALRYVSDNADHRARLSWAQSVEISSRGFDAYLYALAGLIRGRSVAR